MAGGRDNVERIKLVFESARHGEHWFHVQWNPGGQGQEQFEVAANGVTIGKSARIDGKEDPYLKISERFRIKLKKGYNHITLQHLSGDGLRFTTIALCEFDQPPAILNPDLKFLTLKAYGAEIGEPGLMLDDRYVRLYAPGRRASEARIIFQYLTIIQSFQSSF